MKILLFLNDRIVNFSLPSIVSGSYGFDPDNSEFKLINIDSRNGQWILHKTADVSINNNLEEVVLEEYHFYSLMRQNISYVIYTLPILETMNCYSYGDNINMVVGNMNNCNIKYSINNFKNFSFKFIKKNGIIILENSSSIPIYINSLILRKESYNLSYGDTVIVYGIRFLFLKNFIFISNNSFVTVNESNCGLKSYLFSQDNKLDMVEVKDVDLYSANDFFSKTPRFRRMVEEKELKLSSPPSDGKSQEMPLILTVGPMLTMGIVSLTMFFNTIIKLTNGETTLNNSWPSLVSSIAMLISMLVWPVVMNIYNRKMQEKRKKEVIKKYNYYLDDKKKELSNMAIEQRAIMLENLISVTECINNINTKSMLFWSKRIDQNDFMCVRIGIGKAPLNIKISYQAEDFSIDTSELREKADQLVNSFQYIDNTPIGYSFYENKTTAIMGLHDKVVNFTKNILLQLMTFYTYEDVKFVVFTSKEKEYHWDFLKYLNHTFNNEKSFRFFATDLDSSKRVGDYLLQVIHKRLDSLDSDKTPLYRPYYFIIVDKLDYVKSQEFVEIITEMDVNLGFSLVILEERLSKLPSKCNNFINLGQVSSGVLKNSYENQEKFEFFDDIKYDIDYLSIVKKLSNIPIEFEENIDNIPDSISFLEMEQVGKIEQLNILNRWHTNDSTNSLKAEIGVDSHGDLMYLDLHEKYHGPHGLIAGTTGSGKSEFIITYILSMCINYSPDDVSFILIDYKGGGLALAFENRTTGISLPHLAGTITNLDKAEMDRTLVSIDSEVKRRQELFNSARDKLSESTMDIYKYQRFYHEGRLDEPISHLMIICDEFAELKSQQPDFMDNLISVARIGRSLGVHLILATQKPSGVVNDQIWSNTRFRVCLKVQDEADSKEMIKKPDAAYIKQAGRYFLQVGYDEYFALGQSGYSGAKYFPSEQIVKEVDKSINFIDDCGSFIKSIKAGNVSTKQSQGEQLFNILQSIILIAKQERKFSKRLWLDNIPDIILEENIRNKYQIKDFSYQVEAVLGEYDAPEMQEQGIVKFNFIDDGNTLIYGVDGVENEMLLKTIVYSSAKGHKVEELNYYIVDFGSESFRVFNGLPHIGGLVFQGEDEKFNNLLKLLKNEIQERKKVMADYGGDYKNYIKNAKNKLPVIVVILNNFDSIYDNYQSLYDILPELVRDSERYGIVYIITGNAMNSVFYKVSQNFKNIYTFKLKDSSDYTSIFNFRTKLVPKDIVGRGLLKDVNGVHEFQTACIVNNSDNFNQYILDFIEEQKNINSLRAKTIPVLPNFVRLDNVDDYIHNLSDIPIGIDKKELSVVVHNFLADVGTVITSNKLNNSKNFVLSLLTIFSKISNIFTVIVDVNKLLGFSLDSPNYYTDNVRDFIEKMDIYVNDLIEKKSSQEGIIIIYGFSKFVDKLSDTVMLENFFKLLKKYEKIGFIVVEEVNKLKNFSYESWFSSLFVLNTGIWIGRGISDQGILKVSTVNKDMSLNYKNDMGFYVQDNLAVLTKWIDFYSKEDDENEQ